MHPDWVEAAMKTTLEMPDELFRRAKAAAVKRGQSMKELVATAIEREISLPQKPPAAPKARGARTAAVLRDYEALSRRISAVWNSKTGAVEAIREQRREL
jgi:hypothetical protein